MIERKKVRLRRGLVAAVFLGMGFGVPLAYYLSRSSFKVHVENHSSEPIVLFDRNMQPDPLPGIWQRIPGILLPGERSQVAMFYSRAWSKGLYYRIGVSKNEDDDNPRVFLDLSDVEMLRLDENRAKLVFTKDRRLVLAPP